MRLNGRKGELRGVACKAVVQGFTLSLSLSETETDRETLGSMLALTGLGCAMVSATLRHPAINRRSRSVSTLQSSKLPFLLLPG